LKEGTWLHFVIDLYSFMEAFKGQTYRSLDAIQITGNIKLRKIFTTNNLVIDTDDKEQQHHINLLPRNFCFPS
jgi:hypothetical protein